MTGNLHAFPIQYFSIWLCRNDKIKAPCRVCGPMVKVRDKSRLGNASFFESPLDTFNQTTMWKSSRTMIMKKFPGKIQGI